MEPPTTWDEALERIATITVRCYRRRVQWALDRGWDGTGDPYEWEPSDG